MPSPGPAAAPPPPPPQERWAGKLGVPGMHAWVRKLCGGVHGMHGRLGGLQSMAFHVPVASGMWHMVVCAS